MAQSEMLDNSVAAKADFRYAAACRLCARGDGYALIIFVLLKRSVIGYEVRMLGGNPLFALFGALNAVP